jgi:hypothetical protein
VSSIKFEINLSVRIRSVLVISHVALLLYFTILCACPFLMLKLYRCAITRIFVKNNSVLIICGLFSLNDIVLTD